jgi:hypothetical protein
MRLLLLSVLLLGFVWVGEACAPMPSTEPSSQERREDASSQGEQPREQAADTVVERGIESPPEQRTESTPESSTAPVVVLCDASGACATGRTCIDGLCLRACRSNTDCDGGRGEECSSTNKGRYCKRRCDVRFGRAVNPLCPVGTYCLGFCERSPLPTTGTQTEGLACSDALPCDGRKGLFCLQASTMPHATCVRACDPRKGEQDNPGCNKGEACIADEHSFWQGRCAATRAKEAGAWCDGHFQRCKEGLHCYQHMCHRICVHKKGRDGNPDCLATPTHVCTPVGKLSDPLGVCQKTCEGSLGLQDCPVGTTCSGGLCLPGTPFRRGNKQEGELCSTLPAGPFCDGTKGLYCDQAPDRFSPGCVRACDPRKGMFPSPDCAARESCVPDANSPLQGACVAPASASLGARCNDRNQRCKEGLVCYQHTCHLACDAEAQNCAALGAKDAQCWNIRWGGRSFAYCQAFCDTRKGTFSNPDCPKGSYCRRQSSHTSQGMCVVGGVSWMGTRTEGQSCQKEGSFQQRCDGTKKLFCRLPEYTCTKACDLLKGETNNPDCTSQERCIRDTQSFLFGRCVAKGQRTAGQPCTAANPCQAGLFCRRAEGCSIPCQPLQGSSSNPTCPSGMYCNDYHTYVEHPGFCDALPAIRQGPRTRGQDCSNTDATRHCDAKAGLICEPGSLTCVQGCDPKKGIFGNAVCATGQECLEETSISHLGGFCINVTQKLYESCNLSSKRCRAGLVCAEGLCQPGCDMAKGQLNNADCTAIGQGYACLQDRLTGKGVCTKLCDPAKGTLGHPSCPSGMICSRSVSVPGIKAICAFSKQPVGSVKEGGACDGLGAATRLCEKGLVCLEGRCWQACDLLNPLAVTCQGGASCSSNSGSFTGAACLPVASKKAGEWCDQTGRKCAKGLMCEEVCLVACDQSKGQSGNPDCPSGLICTKARSGVSGVCRRPCSLPAQGPLDAACQVGTYCTEVDTNVSACVSSRAPWPSTKQRLDSCLFGAYGGCDRSKGLFCSQSVGQHHCLVACDPRKGKANNASCQSGEVCLVELPSPLQGVCQPVGTQQPKDWCDAGSKRCVQGATCFANQCHILCDSTKGTNNNPDCTGVGKPTRCESIGAGKYVCREICDASLTTHSPTNCYAGAHCVSTSLQPPHKDGLCFPNRPAEQGTRQLGMTCQPGLDCDGSKNLVCIQYSCLLACNPYLGNADCPSGQTCRADQASFKGGYCL